MATRRRPMQLARGSSLLLGVMVRAVLLTVTAGQAAPTCFDEEATSADHADNIAGTPGDAVLIGVDGVNIIDGNGGFDLICGGAGDNAVVIGGESRSGHPLRAGRIRRRPDPGRGQR